MNNIDTCALPTKIKTNIISLKNKLFSFFKNKKTHEYINNNNNNNNNNNTQVYKSNMELYKNKINHVDSKNVDSKNVDSKNVVYKYDDNKIENNISINEIPIAKSFESTDVMIHSSFLLNSIIDKIVTMSYYSNESKEYVKNISNFYIDNEKYNLYKDNQIFSETLYYEFSKLIEEILSNNIHVTYNLRSIKVYENDLTFYNYRAGVFKTDNFILKIDTDAYNFKNEITGMYNIGKGIITQHNIVLPYYVKMFSKHNKTISFSIQPRLHNMITLHYWMAIHNNQCMDIEFYIRMCIRICKSIQFIHSKHIVHGDIKPDNIMIESKTNKPYIIDFGLCGLHDLSEGTGGTKPFCNPITLNIDNYTDIFEYNWVKNHKQNDLWSISLIFATILIFRKCYTYYKYYPVDFFNDAKYVNIKYLNFIPDKFKTPFVYVLTKNNPNITIDMQCFISLLEEAL